MIDPLTPGVMALLEKTAGISSKEALTNIFLLISKSEHDNTDPKKAFLTDKGKSLFGYASALPYDFKQRGVTLGIVGWTTGDSHKDGRGDAPVLFKQYEKLGGENLMPYVDGCCGSKEKCNKLIEKIKSIEDDPLWVLAQFQNLVTGDGYLAKTMDSWKKIGVPNPSALAIATVFDASLNQGWDGKDGGCTHLIKLGVHGDEDATLRKYNAWRRSVAGTNNYNSPPANGKNRADMFEELRKQKCHTLINCDKQMQKALGWEMK